MTLQLPDSHKWQPKSNSCLKKRVIKQLRQIGADAQFVMRISRDSQRKIVYGTSTHAGMGSVKQLLQNAALDGI
jgi:hypothetical protein